MIDIELRFKQPDVRILNCDDRHDDNFPMTRYYGFYNNKKRVSLGKIYELLAQEITFRRYFGMNTM